MSSSCHNASYAVSCHYYVYYCFYVIAMLWQENVLPGGLLLGISSKCGPNHHHRTTWELVRNAVSAPPQTCLIKLCILARSLGDVFAQLSFKSMVQRHRYYVLPVSNFRVGPGGS